MRLSIFSQRKTKGSRKEICRGKGRCNRRWFRLVKKRRRKTKAHRLLEAFQRTFLRLFTLSKSLIPLNICWKLVWCNCIIAPRYYLITEFAAGGDLMDYICYRRKLGEVEVRKFIRQTVSAVHYLHQGGILHRYGKMDVQSKLSERIFL